MRLDGKVALVTGGGRGIGRVIALRCAEEGADVGLAARSTEALEAVASEVRVLGRRALTLPADLRDPGDVQTMARRAFDEFGRIDVLVANSGVGGPSAPLWEVDPQDWHETFAVNVTGTYLCCRAVLPKMIERSSGSIVVVGSMTGKRPLVNRSTYAASKTALIGLVRTLAEETGSHGIRVNLVSPGAVRGERLEWVIREHAEARGISYKEAIEAFERNAPLRRLVEASDVANAVVFLASDEALSITGEDLNVTGGTVMY